MTAEGGGELGKYESTFSTKQISKPNFVKTKVNFTTERLKIWVSKWYSKINLKTKSIGKDSIISTKRQILKNHIVIDQIKIIGCVFRVKYTISRIPALEANILSERKH